MFEYIDITNFQSHRHTRIEFDPGLTVIVGTSLHGKTAIARSLGIVANIYPYKAKNYSNFAPDKGHSQFELGIAGSPPILLEKNVRRKKDKTKEVESTIYGLGLLRDKNGNIVRDENGKSVQGQEFTGVNKDIPDVIKQIINVTTLNIQKQFDQPFLILGSAGEFARTINRITKQEQVDEWVSEFTSRINSKKREVEILEKKTQEIEKELASYSGFEDLELTVKDLEKTDLELKLLEQQYTGLDNIVIKIENVDKILNRIKPALSLESDIIEIQSLENSETSLENKLTAIKKARMIKDKLRSLQSFIDDLKALFDIMEVEQQFKELDNRLEKIEKYDEKIDILNKLLSDMKELDEILQTESEFNKLSASLGKIETINKSIDLSKSNYNNIKDSYISGLKREKKCPTCFSEIDTKTINRLEKEL